MVKPSAFSPITEGYKTPSPPSGETHMGDMPPELEGEDEEIEQDSYENKGFAPIHPAPNWNQIEFDPQLPLMDQINKLAVLKTQTNLTPTQLIAQKQFDLAVVMAIRDKVVAYPDEGYKLLAAYMKI